MRTGEKDHDQRINQILAVCGSKSGRDMDKVAELGLTLADGEEVAAPAIKELPLTLECRVLYKDEQDESRLPEDLRERYYATDAPHTAYYAEIVSAYLLR